MTTFRYPKLLLSMVVLVAIHTSRADELDDAMIASEALQPARLLPRVALMHNEKINLATLSPDGRNLAFWIRDRKKVAVWLQDTETGESRHLFTTSMVMSLGWSADGRYLFMETDSGVAVTGIAVSDQPALVMNLAQKDEQYFYYIDMGSPHHFFASILDESSGEHVLYRIDHEGDKEELYRSEQRLYDFLAPAGGPVRFVRSAVGLLHTFYRIEAGKEQPFLECDYEETCNLRAYVSASDTLYITGRNGGNLTRLMAIDGGRLRELHSDPDRRFDVGSIVLDPGTGEPLIVEYETDFRASYGLTGDARRHLDAINEQLESRILGIQPSRDSGKWLVIDRDPRQKRPRFFLYDCNDQSMTRPLRKLIEELEATEVTIRDDDIAQRIPIWFTASDGMRLQGYVTLPRGLDPASVPLVVMPHGGPWVRTRGHFNRQAQFLANRGYAVFQPNYRASTGFGRNYVIAANRDFGRGRVHDDIIEGTEYVLSRGIGDRNRLAIVGHSFGGFSTLGALAFTPHLFRVGVATAPPAALSKAIKYYFDADDFDGSGFRRIDVMARLAVDIEDPDDVKRSYEQSPDYLAAEVIRPLYIWAGEKDERVNILDVRDYVLRLEAMGKEVTFLSAAGEGHGPRGDTATEAFFYLIEVALYRHIGGRLEVDINAKLQRYLNRSIIVGEL
jgi:dipeptidyl aminopeptidase/acylaminoacyl peptidase